MKIAVKDLATAIEGHEELIAYVDGFMGMPEDRQINIMQEVAILISQNGGTPSYVKEAILYSQLKPTFTPCQVLKSHRQRDPLSSKSLSHAMAQIIGLPNDERRKSILLLLSLLSVLPQPFSGGPE